MSMFPRYTELICPFYEKYRHYRDEEVSTLPKVRFFRRQYVCNVCWNLVKRFARKLKWASHSVS